MPFMIIAIAAILGSFFAYQSYSQMGQNEGKIATLEKERQKASESLKRNKNRANELDKAMSSKRKFIDQWNQHFVSSEDSNVGARLLSEIDGIVRERGMGTTTRKYEQFAFDVGEFNVESIKTELTVTGSYQSLINLIGVLERDNPLSRFEKLNLRSAGDNVTASLSLYHPISVNSKGGKK